MYFSIDRESPISIQEQLRTKFVSAILEGQLFPGSPMPSTRALAKKLRVSRTTVVLVYDKLSEDGFIVANARSGFKVNPELNIASKQTQGAEHKPSVSGLDWAGRLGVLPSHQRNIEKPRNWQKYKYPFVFGQPDPTLFPLAAWRECSRQAMSELAMREWSNDAISEDDPLLIQEIRSKLLPRRGVYAGEDEILITAGAQNALFLIAHLIVGKNTKIGFEEPGYSDARNIFSIHGADMVPMKVDQDGAKVPANGQQTDYLFLTPTFQSPTTVTMSDERRKAFLDYAEKNDNVIIEDDFESEASFLETQRPSLKAEDQSGRVIYVGSLSKSMFPGLRMGYIVAPAAFIRELRALRRLMMRHVPSNNQRTTSLFMSLGFHDSYIRKINRVYAERVRLMADSFSQFLPSVANNLQQGGASFWIDGGEGIDSQQLAEELLKKDVVIEPGVPHFMKSSGNERFFRMGFSSIPTDRIEDGIRALAAILKN